MPARRSTLLTRSTRRTLASYGPTESTLASSALAVGKNLRPMSNMLEMTTKKSNLFQAVSKYDLPYANSFKAASTMKIAVKM